MSAINNELLDDYKESSLHSLTNISEEKLKVKKDLEKAEFEEAVNSLSVRENKIFALKLALGIKEEEKKSNKENAFSAFIDKHRVREEKEINIDIEKENMIELFKSSSKLKQDDESENDSFLLKFNK